MKSVVRGFIILVAVVALAVSTASAGEPTPAGQETLSKSGSRADDLTKGKKTAQDADPKSRGAEGPNRGKRPLAFSARESKELAAESDSPGLAEVWQALCRFLGLSWAWLWGNRWYVLGAMGVAVGFVALAKMFRARAR
jgi:hypothetical protein